MGQCDSCCVSWTVPKTGPEACAIEAIANPEVATVTKIPWPKVHNFLVPLYSLYLDPRFGLL